MTEKRKALAEGQMEVTKEVLGKAREMNVELRELSFPRDGGTTSAKGPERGDKSIIVFEDRQVGQNTEDPNRRLTFDFGGYGG